MTKKFVVVVIVAWALVAVLWRWASDGESGEVESAAPEASAPAAPARAFDELVGSKPVEIVAVPSERASVRSEVAVLREDSRCGVRGRIVEVDGSPVAGIEVVLYEVRVVDLSARPAASVGASFGAVAPPELERARATTDADGRFVLDGARAIGWHALGVGRCALFRVRIAWSPGERRDLGELVLPPSGTLTGRVVDEHGAPLAGVRIRAGELDARLGGSGFFEGLRGDTLAVFDEREQLSVIPVPAWLDRYLDRLPLASARTGSDGRFRVERVAAGVVTAFVDAAERVPVRRDDVVLGVGERLDLGTIVLGRGRTLTIEVVDATGQPVAGAEVRAGGRGPATGVRGGLGFGWLVRSRELGGGAYQTVGLRDGDEPVAAVRRAAHEAWTFVHGDPVTDFVRVELARAHELVVEVVDEAGRALDGAEVALRAEHGPEELPFLRALSDECIVLRSDAEGRATFAALPSGKYRVHARSVGRVSVARLVTLAADSKPERFELPKAIPLDVRVIEAGTGAPIAGVELALALTHGNRVPLDVARTNALGEARLDGAPDRRRQLRVEHPAFGCVLTAVADGAHELELVLSAPGAVVLVAGPGVLRCAELSHFNEGGAMTPEALTSAVDSAGRASFACVAPGRYRFSVWRGSDAEFGARWLADMRFSSDELASGELEVRPGETMTVVLGASEDDALARSVAEVTGRVTFDGAPGVGLRVVARCESGESGSAPTDADGIYRIEGLVSGSAKVHVERAVVGRASEASILCALRGGLDVGPNRIDFPLTTHTLELLVVDEREAPVPGARVVLSFESAGVTTRATTDGLGRATFELGRGGVYRVEASHPTLGAVSQSVALDRARPGKTDVALQLARGTPCRGRVLVSAGALPARELVLTFVARAGGKTSTRVDVALDAGGQGRFEALGLAPGRYRVTAALAGLELEPREFELPSTGATELFLVFRPAD
ncbi:MAG: carboxypeptidase regulatory-like domain-containing protein [Planctomycetes bacterium]|nr:carboxypeptidase regulatory-like domain-containing protein [Planctomycetota bacterium]